MIIQIDSATAENTEAARRSLEALADDWGCEIAEVPTEATTVAGTTDKDEKAFAPVSVASLVLSIPSGALAVQDLTDRIPKRQRAKELIDQAEHLAAQQATVSLVSKSSTIEVRSLDPDRLLDLLAGEDPAS